MLTSHQPLASKAILYEETALLLHKAGVSCGHTPCSSALASCCEKVVQKQCVFIPRGRLAVFVDTFDFRSGGSAGVLLAASGQRTRMLPTAPL